MNLRTKYKIMLVKKYLDRGRSLTSYFNEFILLVGAYGVFTYKNPKLVFAMALGYVLFSLFLGWFYYRFGWEITEQEVNNQYDFLAKELRKKLGIKRKV